MTKDPSVEVMQTSFEQQPNNGIDGSEANSNTGANSSTYRMEKNGYNS